MTYTLPLALEDFIPVILSALGLFIIARMVGRVHSQLGQMALLGGGLAALGGLLKASWKLIIATTGNDIVWMDNSLFVFLAPGFTLMAYALWQLRQENAGKKASWLPPILIILAFYTLSAIMAGRGGRTWVFVLLGLTTLANTATLLLLISLARRQSYTLAAGLFAFNLFIIFMLSGMARIDPQTIPLQWTEQIINTFSQAGFAYAAWTVART
jgi:hypothetical protein